MSYIIPDNIYFSVHGHYLFYCKCNAFIVSFEIALNFENLLRILSWKQKKKILKNKKWNSEKLLPSLRTAQRNKASLIVYSRQ